MSDKNKNPNGTDPNLAEDILRHGGKSEDEVKRTGAIDRAEDEFEKTLDPKFRTANSPVHKAIWDFSVPVELFAQQTEEDKAKSYLAVMDRCVEIVKRHRLAGTLFKAGEKPLNQILAELPRLNQLLDKSEEEGAAAQVLQLIHQMGGALADADQKVNEQVIAELAEAGYWGMLIDPKYGGQGASMVDFMQFITRMAGEGEATVAGMASIHGCIGAVDPIVGYGSDALKEKYLPLLASGKRLSAFALTEPGAGSDLTAVKSTAVLDGDFYIVNGEKLFISNVTPGRTIGLVVKINGQHAVLIADLPEVEDEHFKLVDYGIHAVQHIYNRGIKFTNFRVPKENLLVPPTGNGLTIAYHGLNRGRVALCANAAGVMLALLKSMLPWATFRNTYGQPIQKRELVKRRIARLAALIVGAEALRDWGASLLDQGYRGELECIIAKIFGSDSLLEAAVKALKTHGGRSFLKGHIVGDNLHDLVAPSIYEGENEMLAMAFDKGLLKEVGTQYMGPLMAVMGKAGVNMKKLMKPSFGAVLEGLKLFKPQFRKSWMPIYVPAVEALWHSIPLTGWVVKNELRGSGFGRLLGLVFALWFGVAAFGLMQAPLLFSLLAGLGTAAVTYKLVGCFWNRLNNLGSVPGIHPKLQKHAKWARSYFGDINRTFYRNMLLNGVGLADAQDVMVDAMSMPAQKAVTMLVTCLHASKKGDAATLAAADILCQDLQRELTGGRKNGKYRRVVRKLADMVVAGEFHQLDGVADTEILRKYEK